MRGTGRKRQILPECSYEALAKSAEALGRIDVLTAGFPCQDISVAGRGAGIHGERSGLFFEIIRIAAIVRPRWIILENVSALLARGMDTVLRELSKIGYDAEWDCLPASAFGAHHRRDRVWIVAHPRCSRMEKQELFSTLANAQRIHVEGFYDGQRKKQSWGSSRWEAEPSVGRVVDGLPFRVDRLRALGNALVPPIPEWIGRRILEIELANEK